MSFDFYRIWLDWEAVVAERLKPPTLSFSSSKKKKKKVALISQMRGRGILIHDQPLWQANVEQKKMEPKGVFEPPNTPAYAPDSSTIFNGGIEYGKASH